VFNNEQRSEVGNQRSEVGGQKSVVGRAGWLDVYSFKPGLKCVHGFKVQGFKVQGFKVPFSSSDCIWDANLREKRQLRQA
jgi:hypothetical protein